MVESNISLEEFLASPVEAPAHGGCASCGTGKALAGMTRCGNGLEKIYPTTAVRFGYMRYIGEFSHAPDMKFTCGAKVVIQTKRGIEMGEQVSLTCTGCDKSVTREQMRAWVDACGQDSYIFDAGRILREATAADLAEYARIQSFNRERRSFCHGLASQQGLSIRVVECESPFGGERIIFYFTAETRIDFRGLVKELTREYRTRIEMRQVGARDEARLLADYETCGREVCCKVFLKTLRPITMRMAKLQKATLDPTQVSGRCGRLKCCLRYEHVGYEELDRRLPRVGLRIRTNHGEGVVVNRQVLTQLVQIRTDSDTFVTVVAEDITEVGVPPRPVAAEEAPRPARERPPRRPREIERPRRREDRPAGPQTEPAGMDAASIESEPTGGDTPADSGDGRPPDGAIRRRRMRRRGGRRRSRRDGGPGPGPDAGGSPPGSES
jgi:cell fate regulator YaaT (PSP1 superfamily)